ncbi:hypothetical protein J4E93_010245 [Alternaria ventricosa]|uniref:uncharacterized protein n=1 Tax=Alternaria ventricosa TaxID=1187951 RepID=UPI0020C254CD|nr:uncharacterized protein J4E93_010245 [Alternaria ventricosa]KAI4638246.1 hypothetical protein J4E93_010245 [Alternaria ventricosa]
MAPLFLVYFVVGGIYMLELDKTTYVSEKPESYAPAELKSYMVLCVACAAAWIVLSIYTAMFGGRKGAEEYAGRKTMVEDVGQRDEGGTEWFDINLLKNDSEVDEEDEKQLHFFDNDDGIGDVSFGGGSSEDNIGKKSLGNASGLG